MKENLRNFLDSLVGGGVCPGLAAAVCSDHKVLFTYSTGYQQCTPNQVPMADSSLFDVASLTKVMSTTMVSSVLRDRGLLAYDKPLKYYLSHSGNFSEATVHQLLTHTAGFVAEQRLDSILSNRDNSLKFILGTQPVAAPGTTYIYSCFGFIVLGKILEHIAGCSLDRAVNELVFQPLGMKKSLFNPIQFGYTEESLVATEYVADLQKTLVGVVHDENARFLGGVAGNAGLFTCLEDVIQFCQMLLRDGCSQTGQFLSRERIQEFSTDYTKQLQIGRGIGFLLGSRGDTPASSNAGIGNFGHTGFTGTSLWISPSKKIAAILLTNRVHPSRANTALLPLRKKFHALAFED